MVSINTNILLMTQKIFFLFKTSLSSRPICSVISTYIYEWHDNDTILKIELMTFLHIYFLFSIKCTTIHLFVHTTGLRDILHIFMSLTCNIIQSSLRLIELYILYVTPFYFLPSFWSLILTKPIFTLHDSWNSIHLMNLYPYFVGIQFIYFV